MTARQFVFHGLLYLIALMGNNTAQAAPTPSEAHITLSYEQARQLMPAVGRVLLQQQLTDALLQDCQSVFPHLKDSAGRAQQVWQQNNQATVEQARHIEQWVADSISETQSGMDAERFGLDIDTAIHNGVKQFRQDLADKKRKQRHYLCNRLILAVTAGDWDLKVKVPEDVAVISKFKQ